MKAAAEGTLQSQHDYHLSYSTLHPAHLLAEPWASQCSTSPVAPTGIRVPLCPRSHRHLCKAKGKASEELMAQKVTVPSDCSRRKHVCLLILRQHSLLRNKSWSASSRARAGPPWGTFQINTELEPQAMEICTALVAYRRGDFYQLTHGVLSLSLRFVCWSYTAASKSLVH